MTVRHPAGTRVELRRTLLEPSDRALADAQAGRVDPARTAAVVGW